MSAKTMTGTQARVLEHLAAQLNDIERDHRAAWLVKLIVVQLTRTPRCEHWRAAELIKNVRRYLDEVETGSVL